MTLTISRHYEGYPGVVQGGYAAGLMAAGLGPAAEVTLRAPPPVETHFDASTDDDRVRYHAAGTLVGEARAATLDLDVPAPPSYRDAMQVRGRCAAHLDIPWANCFACGTARGEGEGLQVWPGEIGDALIAAPWTPGPAFQDDEDLLRPEYLWSALDCPGWYALMGGDMRALVTGRMTVRIDARPAAGADLVVIAWPMRPARGRLLAGSAVWDGGRLIASARSVWFERPHD